ncbi:hypothetical protein Q8A67_015755 [Cirrhinus molitorella]|uniref:Uncharacterized protein n=1 Tax=Cirrhinus molitorella TaxID=172907 RepID=A0AA88TTP9_9TELE|nr:hypothetical protein Q8A67_015755 [Cirrhinus molitorella]
MEARLTREAHSDAEDFDRKLCERSSGPLLSLKVRGLGTWEGTTLLQPNKDFFPTSAFPPSPSPPFHFLLST